MGHELYELGLLYVNRFWPASRQEEGKEDSSP
jgi:hypothetical protein